MTAAEAASLVLKAGISGASGEVFWLDMGRPLRLGELVNRILDVATPPDQERSAISFIGLRPGEKRHEELTSQGLEMHATDDPAIWRARQSPIDSSITLLLARLREACAAGDAADALRAVRAAVPDYVPSPQARAAAIRQQVALRGKKRPGKHTLTAAVVPWRKPA
jgi:FlaA1/EpsC-like NDP-sugar epimerase